jgi:hypothetical protein
VIDLTPGGGPVVADPADETTMSGLLHGMFAKPDAPLCVSPAVIAGELCSAAYLSDRPITAISSEILAR